MTPETSSLPLGHAQGWSVWQERGRWTYSAWCRSECEMGFAPNEGSARFRAEQALRRLVDKRHRETKIR